MWLDHAKSLFQDTDKMISIRANLFQLNPLTSEGQTSNLKLHLDVCDKYRTILGCSSSRVIECVHSGSSNKNNLFTSDHQTFLGDNSSFSATCKEKPSPGPMDSLVIEWRLQKRKPSENSGLEVRTTSHNDKIGIMI